MSTTTTQQIQSATQQVRKFFNGSATNAFPTQNGTAILVSDRTLDAKKFRSLDHLTKKHGCTYSIAPAVGKQDAGFVISIAGAES